MQLPALKTKAKMKMSIATLAAVTPKVRESTETSTEAKARYRQECASSGAAGVDSALSPPFPTAEEAIETTGGIGSSVAP